jgi:hypothetical protein
MIIVCVCVCVCVCVYEAFLKIVHDHHIYARAVCTCMHACACVGVDMQVCVGGLCAGMCTRRVCHSTMILQGNAVHLKHLSA